ncbi:MAG: hypothetical protein RSD27_02405 [Ruthenibacterium sp.]
MIVNIIHRPAAGRLMEMFRLQQSMAHDLGLKTNILVPFDFLFDADAVHEIAAYHENYGDEIGLWLGEIAGGRMKDVFPCSEPFLWLHTKENKRKILTAAFAQFEQAFDCAPAAMGCYHVDAYSMQLIKELCPSVKISIAGCFEEGVKVFHGCNHSWYLFNEGMPWGPWYPSAENTLRPANTEADWCGVVAVPHLSRDLALSYEGRNDFFASHPANVQRAMANDGANAPYVHNLLDLYRFQERYQNGFSYTNVFVGPNWLCGSANVQDSDEITQNLYREYLAYFAQLRTEGALIDMHMSEFAAWYRANIKIGAPQIYHAKELLYGSGKHYFWYSDADMRVTIDPCQGGSIGDLRPLVAKQPRASGADMPCREMASNPYLIHSQYRTGNAHHYADGARTTLLVTHTNSTIGKSETLDLANYPVKIEKIMTLANGSVQLVLTPAALQFSGGVCVSLVTQYLFSNGGKIYITRTLAQCSDAAAVFSVTEYCKGCYGVTEYPKEMQGISLFLGECEDGESICYAYEGRSLATKKQFAASAKIPALQTVLSLQPQRGAFTGAEVTEGYLFSPYFTLTVSADLTDGEEMCTCLSMKKSK